MHSHCIASSRLLRPSPISSSCCRDEWTEILPRYNVISSPHLSAYNLWPTGQVKTILHANTMPYIMHYCTANAFKHRPLAALVIGDLLTWVMRVSVPNVPYSRQWLRSEKSKKVLRRERERRAHLPGTAVWSASFSVLANLLTLVLLKFSLFQHQ